MSATIKSNLLESRVIGAIVATATVSLGFGVAATATPHWHYTDSAVQHMRRGLFQACSVEAVNGAASYTCAQHDSTPFCGHSYDDTRNRFVWPAVLAVLSLVVLASIPIGATASWCLFRPRPRTLLAITLLSMVLMLIATSVFISTMDGWYFCGAEFCNYAKSQLLNSGDGLCNSGLGFSFVLAMIYLGGLVVVAVTCALYARWVRLGAIVDPSIEASASSKAATAATKVASDNDAHVIDGAAQPSSSGSPDAGVQDWVVDPKSSLLWSAHHQLFLNPADGRFYDPSADSWYVPETDQWIPAH